MRTLNTLITKPPAVAQARHRGQQGFAFVIVLGILLLITGLALVAFNTSNTDRQISSNSLSTTRAYYSAEAGAIKAMAQLNDSVNWRAGYSNVAIGNSKYTVQVIDSLTQPALKDSLLLRSTGNAIGSPNGTESVVEVLLARVIQRTFKYAAFGDVDVKMTGGAFTDSYDSDSGTYASQAVNGPDGKGNMYSGPLGGSVGGNNTIDVGGNAMIHGNVTTPGSISTGGGSIVYGSQDPNAPSTYLPPITAAEMNNAKTNSVASSGLTITGSASYDLSTKALSANGGTITFSSGLYYFSSVDVKKGNLVIPSGVQVVIYTDGNIDAKGGGIVNSSLKAGNLQIYSTGTSVDLNAGALMYATVYALNADITINGGADAYGSFMGKSIKLNGGGHIHFDRSLLNLNNSKQKYAQVAWKVL